MPLTEDYTFQLDSGPMLNTSAILPFVDIRRVRGLSSAPYRETERQHEGQDGGFMDAEFEQGRHIILEGSIYCDVGDPETYIDQLKGNFAPVRTPIPFYILPPGKAERVVFVKPLGLRYDWEELRRSGVTEAQFLMFAEDPRVYTSTQQSVVIDVNFEEDLPGFGFDFGFDFSFGAPVIGNGENIIVGGNRPTPPLLTIDCINGPCVHPRIPNLTYNRNLETDITLNTGDQLVLDPHYRTVTLNGTANRRASLIVDDWFFLQVGANFIGFRSDSDDDSTLTVTYRNAWR